MVSDHTVVDSGSLRGVGTARQVNVSVSRVAWSACRTLRYDEWCRQGAHLSVAEKSSAWWLGDWLRYGVVQYGRRYAIASRVTGYDGKTLRNLAYVAGRYASDRRREEVSWSHHAELASLDPEQQERWLDRAVAERLSIKALRQRLSAQRHDAHAGRAGDLPETRTLVFRTPPGATAVRGTPAQSGGAL
jgi:hypothetical protein